MEERDITVQYCLLDLNSAQRKELKSFIRRVNLVRMYTSQRYHKVNHMPKGAAGASIRKSIESVIANTGFSKTAWQQQLRWLATFYKLPRSKNVYQPVRFNANCCSVYKGRAISILLHNKRVRYAFQGDLETACAVIASRPYLMLLENGTFVLTVSV